MNNDLTTVGLIISIVLSMIAVYPQFRRVKSQNTKDSADALASAFEIANIDAESQKMLRLEVEELRKEVKSWEKRRYRLSFVFTLSDNPTVTDLQIEYLHDKIPPFWTNL